MSERTQAPRPGGRAADPQRRSTGRRDTTGTSRDADAPGNAGRGARRFAGADEDGAPRRSDTRRSGTRSDAGRERGEARQARSAARGSDSVRGKARDTEAVRSRAQARDTEGVRAKARDTEGVRAKGRIAEGARLSARKPEPVRGRGRRVEAPVDGAAALQIDLSAEPLKVTDPAAAPRLRVAPPPPIHGGPRAPFVASVIGVVVVGVLGILLINTKTNENSFRISDMQKQNTALENQRQDLENQVVEASSIGNLDAAARRLGLVKADSVAQIRLPDGKIINFGVPATGKRSPTAQEAVGETSPVTDKGAGNVTPADGAGR
ncbi:hypothetical protein OWR29_11785 [Actinoplanes sp. Pm04-4]|uniref:Cell division protein FtsL n=1 Tax=Paractinoplanes pyxinae TaxID=2997416 RepID=A0ABT4AWS0_9ACTN|nr:hypothetical protein [Actinoplanes pyxinae]MCY1138679.1 hypothetical protein [Actinoplanes pyxinae]